MRRYIEVSEEAYQRIAREKLLHDHKKLEKALDALLGIKQVESK